MTKIVYNACYGGFGLSEEAIILYAKIKGTSIFPEKNNGLTTYWTIPPEEREGKVIEDNKWYSCSLEERQASNAFYKAHVIYDRDFERDDPVLVQVVEELGDAANGFCAKLRIADIPAGTPYRIDEYDGFESVDTNDSYEWKIAK